MRGKYQFCYPAFSLHSLAFSASQKPLGYNQLIFSCLLIKQMQGKAKCQGISAYRAGLCTFTLSQAGMLEQICCSGPGGAAKPARGGQSCSRAGAACSIPPNIWMLSTSQLGEHLSEQRSTHWMAVYITFCWVFTMFNPPHTQLIRKCLAAEAEAEKR